MSVLPRWLMPDWPAPSRVRALSTLRGGGASRPPFASLNLGGHVEDSPLAVTKNRRSLREAAGLPAEPVWLVQVHGTAVANLDAVAGSSGGGPAESALGPPPVDVVADAAVTRLRGRVCAVLTADCLPVLFTTDQGDRVGAAHAGWRGLAGGVIEATVRALDAEPGKLMAWLGPAIGPDRFEVGPEVREAFLAEDEGAHAAFMRGEGTRYLADLYLLARRRLSRLGIDRVYGGGDCTHQDAQRFFSHRRDGRTGRQATLIWLEGSESR